MAKPIRRCFKLTGNVDVLSNCYATIAELYQTYHSDTNLHVGVTVEVMDKDKARTVAQNALYWQWVTIVGNDSGLSKDEQHAQFKRNHLAKIYHRDNPEFGEMVAAMNAYKQHATQAEYEQMAQGVARLMSTTKATTKQMSEYLDDIDKFYTAKGLSLPKPDDYQWILGRANV
ncbi:hypothetical protein [Psychrobacter pygoscelis]|uniref:hypothetical protein n=1 Tax=Psychrobacter pygoscelis TaxID=2488563 RepID=UPI00103D7D3E|nr:hypothetical protein [Psychrobacter pygoscelis]